MDEKIFKIALDLNTLSRDEYQMDALKEYLLYMVTNKHSGFATVYPKLQQEPWKIEQLNRIIDIMTDSIFHRQKSTDFFTFKDYVKSEDSDLLPYLTFIETIYNTSHFNEGISDIKESLNKSTLTSPSQCML